MVLVPAQQLRWFNDLLNETKRSNLIPEVMSTKIAKKYLFEMVCQQFYNFAHTKSYICRHHVWYFVSTTTII
jgi:hypothetical protein